MFYALEKFRTESLLIADDRGEVECDDSVLDIEDFALDVQLVYNLSKCEEYRIGLSDEFNGSSIKALPITTMIGISRPAKLIKAIIVIGTQQQKSVNTSLAIRLCMVTATAKVVRIVKHV